MNGYDIKIVDMQELPKPQEKSPTQSIRKQLLDESIQAYNDAVNKRLGLKVIQKKKEAMFKMIDKIFSLPSLETDDIRGLVSELKTNPNMSEMKLMVGLNPKYHMYVAYLHGLVDHSHISIPIPFGLAVHNDKLKKLF